MHLSQDNLCSCLGKSKCNDKNEYNTNGGHMDVQLYGLTKEICNIKTGNAPQRFLHNGQLIRKHSDMTNLQLTYYVDKVKNLLSLLKPSNRNPLRLLNRAMENWEHKDKRPIFKFREISLEETSGLISSMSESTAL